MSRARKGWCPSLYQPMPSGDGLLVRLRPPGGALSAEAARSLAAAAARDGNGVIELTQRAAIQVRGLSPATLPRFTSAVVAAGLADPNPSVERRRRVLFPPLADETTVAVARTIEAALSHDARLAELPEKFCVSVDGGGALPLGDVGADIVVVCAAERCLVGLAGSDLAAVCVPEDVADAVVRLAAKTLIPPVSHREREQVTGLLPLPLGLGCEADQGRGEGLPPRSLQRIRTLVAVIGAESVFAAAGITPSGSFVAPKTRPAIGPIGNAFGVGLAFGTCDAPILMALADLAEQFADGTLRLTPWRAIVLAGVTADSTHALQARATALGLIATAHDPRSLITTCVGQHGCRSASVDTRADAATLATLDLKIPLHLSGCAKGCAHPAAAPVTLTGADGRYNFVRNGRAGDSPLATGLTLAQAATLLQQAAA